jgi:hypothetical protein
MTYQDRPPYYVLATDRLDYAELRRLRHELKQGAGLDPDEIEGCPTPRLQIADCRLQILDFRMYTNHGFLTFWRAYANTDFSPFCISFFAPAGEK